MKDLLLEWASVAVSALAALAVLAGIVALSWAAIAFFVDGSILLGILFAVLAFLGTTLTFASFSWART